VGADGTARVKLPARIPASGVWKKNTERRKPHVAIGSLGRNAVSETRSENGGKKKSSLDD